MSLRVMTLVGCFALVLGFIMLWLAPAATVHPGAVKSIGTNSVNHSAYSSAGQPTSRTVDHPDFVDSREEWATPGR